MKIGAIDLINEKSEVVFMAITEDTRTTLYEARPFMTRNADEVELSSILNLFVDPTDGVRTPFDYENMIIKGKMGSGKTMFLRANYASYIYSFVNCLMDGIPFILPVYINLSNLEMIQDPNLIYNNIIIDIVKNAIKSYEHLFSAEYLARLHTGMQALPYSMLMLNNNFQNALDDLKKLSADQYEEKFKKRKNAKGGLITKYLNISGELEKESEIVFETKPNPSIRDIDKIYNQLLEPFDGKLLILLDEVGSLDKTFFQGNNSYFEKLMNQLRTISYVRTKIAVYPNQIEDKLNETRYGDVIQLQDNIRTDNGYDKFESKVLLLIDNYISKYATDSIIQIQDIFEIEDSHYGPIEMLSNASDGNMRRLVHLLDLSMSYSYRLNHGKAKVNNDDAICAIKEDAASLEDQFTETERNDLSTLVNICKEREAYMFTCPYKSIKLVKYSKKSSEYNLIKIIENGAGRRGTVYSFDFAYCVLKDIPTHFLRGTKRLDKSRSRRSGEYIRTVTDISEDVFKMHHI